MNRSNLSTSLEESRLGSALPRYLLKGTASHRNNRPSLKEADSMCSSTDQSEDGTVLLLQERQRLTESLYEEPYDLIRYLERATVYSDLSYPDLAAGDSYRALLLCDEVRDDSFEYHEQAVSTLQLYSADDIPAVLRKHGSPPAEDLSKSIQGLSLSEEDGESRLALLLAERASLRCYQILAISLLLCGCLKSAYEFCGRGLALAPDDEELAQTKEYIENLAKRKIKNEELDINKLPDQGLARREVYPWNDHEPDRFSAESLDFLNSELKEVAPKCEVKATFLPTLVEVPLEGEKALATETNKQLGLFAKEDISPGETVLDEYTVLTANNRLKESLCDACSTLLPPLGPDSTTVSCPSCTDTMSCNEYCLTHAQETYHPSICDKDLDTIAKDPDPKETPNALYLLLLSRTLAMAATQDIHPLDLKEVKYIWGDFLPTKANDIPLSLPNDAKPPPVWTLPFSFSANISSPLHILEKMDVDIYRSLSRYDLWIFNTLYAKFRGTASARVSTRDGRPEVAAVHPLWCLANHDCDPNVQWEWGGRMRLWCREKRVDGSVGGVLKGEEILNHYCDVELGVKDRREWARGSLGGDCMCGRCRREAGELERREP